jgi:uncharacterized protein YecT (DUF1311 family)
MHTRALLAAILTAAATLAAVPPVRADDTQTITACLDAERKAARDGRACIGKTSDPCLEGSGSDSTQSMVECLDGETKVWDGLLNSDYQALLGALPKPAADGVRAAQRAWIASRDADCKVPYDIYEGGTIARIDSASCVLEHTASRVLHLRTWQQMAGPDE